MNIKIISAVVMTGTIAIVFSLHRHKTDSPEAQPKSDHGIVSDASPPSPPPTPPVQQQKQLTPAVLPVESRKNIDNENGLNQLSLIGTVVGEQEFALIRNNANYNEKLFKKNDSIFDVGLLKVIRNNSVIIAANGKQIELSVQSKSSSMPLRQEIPVVFKPAPQVQQPDLPKPAQPEVVRNDQPIIQKSPDELIAEGFSLFENAMKNSGKNSRP
jgi:hypothetical protein